MQHFNIHNYIHNCKHCSYIRTIYQIARIIEFPFLSMFQFPCNEIEWTGHAYRRIWPIAKWNTRSITRCTPIVTEYTCETWTRRLTQRSEMFTQSKGKWKWILLFCLQNLIDILTVMMISSPNEFVYLVENVRFIHCKLLFINYLCRQSRISFVSNTNRCDYRSNLIDLIWLIISQTIC